MASLPRRRRAASLSRRDFLELCGIAGAGLISLPGTAGCGDDPGASVDGSGDATDPDAGPAAPFPVPPLDDGEVVDGVRVFRLTLSAGTVEWVAGYPTVTWGVNGAYLGPTLRMRTGERVRIEVTNDLAVTTTLHWHGVAVPAAMDGGPYQTIAPGATWVSEFEVDQRAATVWYHPHQMHETGRHVYMGMAGLILIEDEAPAVALPSTYGVDDLPLVIQDRRLAADGTHPYSGGATPAMHDHMAGLRGETILVNGVRAARGVVPRGLTRLRVLNGSNARIYHLGFADDRSFVQIASDGGLLAAPLTTTRVLLAPGERAELLVDFGGDAAGAEVGLVSYSGEVFDQLFQGMMGANLSDALDRATFDVMTLVVGEPPAEVIAPPVELPAIARMVEADASGTRTVALSMGGGAVAINGAQMTELGNVPAAINFQIAQGTIELWTLTNSSGMAHPVHVHNRHFQVLDVDGAPPPAPLAGWKDTVIVGPGQTVRVLIPFDGTTDPDHPYMFHCHILEHEDMGMMGQFFLVA